jgi:hypothetical protein
MSHRWMSSNVTTEQAYLLTLHEQLFELQQYVYQSSYITERQQFSNYYLLRLQYTYENESYRECIDTILNIIFNHRYHIRPIFSVWKWHQPVELSKDLYLDMYILFETSINVTQLRALLIQTNPRFTIRQVTPMTDSYQFIQHIKHWKPTPNSLFDSSGCEAWYRYIHPIHPEFENNSIHPFTLSSNYIQSVSLQEKFQNEWDLDTLQQLLNVDHF